MKHLELSVGFKGVFKPPFTDMTITPNGDRAREATDALRGYVYQIYQSCLAWIELRDDELLFLEVAEDFSILAAQALEAVQVKATAKNVTINSSDIVTSIDSFVALQLENPDLQVRVRHLTTSSIGREKLAVDRIGDTPALESWRKLAKGGDVDSFRKILENSKLATRTKGYIRELDNEKFRGEFLKRIHFDCGALDAQFVERQLRSKLAKLLIDRGGIHSQVDRCFNSLFMHLLTLATKKTDRVVDRHELEILLEHATKILVSHAQLELQNQLINQALTASLPQTKNIMATGLIKSGPIDDVPFQAARASRTSQIDNIEASLLQWGVSWIYGAAGVGKTFGARLAAWRFNGNWATVYLRGLNTTEVDAVLSGVIETVVDQQLVGLLVDDLECSLEPYIVDKILWLLAVCDRSDILIIITTPKPADSNLLFRANLTAAIAQKFEEFTEDDIKEILVALGVNGERWARYIFIVSGRGHPQLAIAAIQSMQSNGWDVQDLRTLGSLISGNYAIDDV
ncbi:MAG: hypothetical protein KUG81_10970, partial [Gammaproteobacteria bacterium]|nr:hypothetical protein [Gammaproteobacteria bacterium]